MNLLIVFFFCHVDHFEKELNDVLKECRDTLILITQSARIAMNQASKEIRRCDPDKHIEGMKCFFFSMHTIQIL